MKCTFSGCSKEARYGVRKCSSSFHCQTHRNRNIYRKALAADDYYLLPAPLNTKEAPKTRSTRAKLAGAAPSGSHNRTNDEIIANIMEVVRSWFKCNDDLTHRECTILNSIVKCYKR